MRVTALTLELVRRAGYGNFADPQFLKSIPQQSAALTWLPIAYYADPSGHASGQSYDAFLSGIASAKEAAELAKQAHDGLVDFFRPLMESLP